jgi:hypothetical protein
MIAPLNETGPQSPSARRHFRAARRVVASTFLSAASGPGDGAPSIPAWRAWLFAGWVLVVTAAYFAGMLGLW